VWLSAGAIQFATGFEDMRLAMGFDVRTDDPPLSSSRRELCRQPERDERSRSAGARVVPPAVRAMIEKSPNFKRYPTGSDGQFYIFV
jgi:hypothetical protein